MHVVCVINVPNYNYRLTTPIQFFTSMCYLQTHGCPKKLKVVDRPAALRSEVFEAFSHNHANEEDRSAVFKTYVRHAMDEIIGRSRRIGPKQLRTDLAENIGYNNPDLPNRNQVGYPTCLFTLKYFV